MTDFENHLTRQMVFSKATYGHGARTKGVIKHIKKELIEVEGSSVPATEWVDVVILALDGLTRAVWEQARYGITAPEVARTAVAMIVAKQGKNELRDWPDWRKSDPERAIEHVRGDHD